MPVLYMSGKPVDFNRDLDPTMMVRWDRRDTGGDIVRGSLRTIAHIDQENIRALAIFGAPYTIIQPPYNVGYPPSAGTHDKDVMRDWYIPGVSWWTQQRFGRSQGEFVWYRYPPAFGNHLHGGTLPIPNGGSRFDDFDTPVGVYVPAQLVDYYNHAFGLSGMHTPGSDRSWFPKDIDSKVFNLDRYIQKQRELNMEYKDWSPESKAEATDDVVKALLGAKLKVRKSANPDDGLVEVTVRQALARGAYGQVQTRESARDLIREMREIDEANDAQP